MHNAMPCMVYSTSTQVSNFGCVSLACNTTMWAPTVTFCFTLHQSFSNRNELHLVAVFCSSKPLTISSASFTPALRLRAVRPRISSEREVKLFPLVASKIVCIGINILSVILPLDSLTEAGTSGACLLTTLQLATQAKGRHRRSFSHYHRAIDIYFGPNP